jgi:hypothetical protein
MFIVIAPASSSVESVRSSASRDYPVTRLGCAPCQGVRWPLMSKARGGAGGIDGGGRAFEDLVLPRAQARERNDRGRAGAARDHAGWLVSRLVVRARCNDGQHLRRKSARNYTQRSQPSRLNPTRRLRLVRVYRIQCRPRIDRGLVRSGVAGWPLNPTRCPALRDAPDRLLNPFGQVFPIYQRPCARSHRARCKEDGLGKIHAAGVHTALVPRRRTSRPPELLQRAQSPELCGGRAPFLTKSS